MYFSLVSEELFWGVLSGWQQPADLTIAQVQHASSTVAVTTLLNRTELKLPSGKYMNNGSTDFYFIYFFFKRRAC